MLDFLLIIQSSLFYPVDLSKWLVETEKVYEEIKKMDCKKNKRPRIVLTGAPMVWPNFKLLNILEELNTYVIADTMCTGAQSCYDPIVASEYSKASMLRGLINKYVYAAICPCFISQTTRINRILDLVSETKADGVINYTLRLCQLFDIETYRVEKILKQNKIPFINIKTDYSLEDKEQIRVRVEAFLENV